MFLSDSYISDKKNILNSKSIPSDVTSYHDFCTFQELKKLIKVPTRTATSSSTIIHYILASYPERVAQCGVIDIGLPNHQLIYCTRNILGLRRVDITKYGSVHSNIARSIFLNKNYRNKNFQIIKTILRLMSHKITSLRKLWA